VFYQGAGVHFIQSEFRTLKKAALV